MMKTFIIIIQLQNIYLDYINPNLKFLLISNILKSIQSLP